LNIDPRWFDVVFTCPDETHEIIGANKSYRSGVNGYLVMFRIVTTKTFDGKFRVIIYGGEGVKYIQDAFELDVGHKQEVLRVLKSSKLRRPVTTVSNHDF
jgi:hypothetical protein